jgi:hypothetical protein
MSLSAKTDDIFRHAAVIVDKVLKGARPADLPVEQPAIFGLILNLKTARLASPSRRLSWCRRTRLSNDVVHLHGDARFGCARAKLDSARFKLTTLAPHRDGCIRRRLNLSLRRRGPHLAWGCRLVRCGKSAAI